MSDNDQVGAKNGEEMDDNIIRDGGEPSSASESAAAPPLFYGRQEESALLMDAFQRSVTSTGNKEICIVNGSSGSGKTRLVHHVLLHPKQQQATTTTTTTTFLAGKFDQRKQHKAPYEPFVCAFTAWCKQQRDVLSENIRERLHSELDMEQRTLLVDTIPALQGILKVSSSSSRNNSASRRRSSKRFVPLVHPSKEQSQQQMEGLSYREDEIVVFAASDERSEHPSSIHHQHAVTPSATTPEAQKRQFLAAFGDFVRIISNTQHPLILFLDDLQWSDQSSLDLLSALATRDDLNGFFLVGAVRGNEVKFNDPLAETLRKLEDENVAITTINMTNFTRTEVEEMLLQQFPTTTDTNNVDKISEDVFNQTEGNVFYIVQLMKLYQGKGVLFKDQGGREWHWDENRIEHRNKRSVSDVLKDALQQLPTEIQVVLEVAACLGSRFSVQHIQIALPDYDVKHALEVACEKGIVQYSGGGLYGQFIHDRLQEETYKLLPESRRALVHATIGRKLLQSFSDAELDDNIFLVVNQLGSGIEHIVDSRERSRLALLCLFAGEKAVMSSAFGPAAEYLDLGISCLEAGHWVYQYDLSLALFNASAEVQYCNGKFEKMESLVNEVFDNAKSFDDKIRCYTSHVFALGAQQRFQEAIDTGLYVLGQLGTRFPARPRKIYSIVAVLKTKRMLRGKTADDILRLPLMTDPRKLATVHILNLIALYVFFTRQAFMPLITTHFVRTTLESGLSGFGASGFGYFAMLTCGVLGDIDGGYLYSKIALRLLDKFHAKSYVARVYTPVYGMVTSWKEPVRNCLEKLKTAHDFGMKSGDIEFAMLSAFLYVSTSNFAGVPLPSLRIETLGFVGQAKAYKQQGMLSLLQPFGQMVDNLMGNARGSISVLSGEIMDEESYLRHPEHKTGTTQFAAMNVRRLIVVYIMDDLVASELSAVNSRQIEKEIVSSLTASVQAFYDGLCSVALARKTTVRQRRASHLKRARLCLKKLKRWESKCPENFSNKVLLVEAELASFAGKVDVAMDKYKGSIDRAGAEGFVQDQAIATERMGDAIMRRSGRCMEARDCYETARSLYDTWGAQPKVKQIDELLSGKWQDGQPTKAT